MENSLDSCPVLSDQQAIGQDTARTCTELGPHTDQHVTEKRRKHTLTLDMNLGALLVL